MTTESSNCCRAVYKGQQYKSRHFLAQNITATLSDSHSATEKSLKALKCGIIHGLKYALFVMEICLFTSPHSISYTWVVLNSPASFTLKTSGVFSTDPVEFSSFFYFKLNSLSLLDNTIDFKIVCFVSPLQEYSFQSLNLNKNIIYIVVTEWHFITLMIHCYIYLFMIWILNSTFSDVIQ